MSEPDPRLERYLSAYKATRETRSALKREYDETDAKHKKLLAMLEVALMKLMKETGSDNLSIKGLAQAYISPKTFYSAKDWDAVWSYIEESGNLALLGRKLARKGIEEYMDANDGDLPPGVDVHTERTVVIRTA